ncbi:hypothetical protein CK203_003204 [Vitis vinifera]|uniref:Uncharacterized protein n=1 Tax=Vitis vinifera TaxID=29760 RepID=A0A438K734_VITVI|nr:hypothetical protein CK203_003204 [Vitis vinifera]
MASKTLIRAGASLIKGLSNRSLLHQNTTPNHRILLSGSVGVTPKLFPSLAKPQPSLHLHETLDSQILKELAFDSQALFYPCGLPSLRFFLPDGDSSSEPMLLFPKRTYQPSHIKRKRTHGFFARYISLILAPMFKFSLYLLAVNPRKMPLPQPYTLVHGFYMSTQAHKSAVDFTY